MSTYYLVLFDDGIYYGTTSKYIKRGENDSTSIKWTNGRWYTGKAICSARKETLQTVLPNLNLNMPRIVLQRISEDQSYSLFQHGHSYDGCDEESEGNSDDSIKDRNYEPLSSDSETTDDDLEPTQVKTGESLSSSSSSSINAASYANNVTKEHDTPIPYTATTENGDASNICNDENVAFEERHAIIKKKYSKKYNICIFCNKKNLNIDRHFQQIHKDEIEVKTFMSLPKKCAERKKLMANLRKMGNFKYNTDENRTQNDDFFVARKLHTRDMDNTNYTPCPKCKIFITKGALRRHYRMCETDRKGHTGRNVLTGSRVLLGKIHNLANKTLKERILPVMREDPMKELICYDDLIILYGNTMCDKYRNEHHFDMIRSRLRIMARFLSTLKSIDPCITDLKSAFRAEHFHTITQALFRIGEYNGDTQHFMKPSLPSTIGTALKYICKLYISQCIKTRDHHVKKEVKDLMTLLNTDLESTVNKTASESILQQRRQKKVILPDTKDIKKLNDFLIKQREKYYDDLQKNGYSYTSWLQLSKYTLTSILIFNRRRPGELERAHVTDYKNFQRIDPHKNPELYQSLSEQEKQTAKLYVRFAIRGKLARGVPVLLHNDMRKCIEMLLKYRDQAGIDPRNPYIFALPQIIESINANFKYLRANALIRTYAAQCNISNPNILRATQLRKHIATKSALLNLDEENVHCLQNFLGHEEKIHNQIYRQPLEHREIINISQLLEIGQGKNNDADTVNSEGSTSKHLHESSSTDLFYDSDESNHLQNLLEKEENLVSSDDSNPGPSHSLQASSQKRHRLLDVESRHIQRRSWSSDEKRAVKEIFGEYLASNTLPSTKDCYRLIKNNNALKQRSSQQIRLWIRSQIGRKTNTGKSLRRSWETPERNIIKTCFQEYIQPDSINYPTLKEIEEVKNKHNELQNRTPRKIKSQIQHLRSKVVKSCPPTV